MLFNKGTPRVSRLALLLIPIALISLFWGSKRYFHRADAPSKKDSVIRCRCAERDFAIEIDLGGSL
jgi:hypothetical protein